mmetsp:Transcript_118202/g.341734  ORF Transcript_118202/g.341734 Transcript_118202/m.341734 type:complete len:106 (-) Transcript_118202:2160-2477(-)
MGSTEVEQVATGTPRQKDRSYLKVLGLVLLLMPTPRKYQREDQDHSYQPRIQKPHHSEPELEQGPTRKYPKDRLQERVLQPLEKLWVQQGPRCRDFWRILLLGVS